MLHPVAVDRRTAAPGVEQFQRRQPVRIDFRHLDRPRKVGERAVGRAAIEIGHGAAPQRRPVIGVVLEPASRRGRESDRGGLRGRLRGGRRCRDAPRPAGGGSCGGDVMLPGAAGRVTAADCEGGSIGPNEIGIVPS